MENSPNPFSAEIPLTSRFVDVPIRVHIPPNITTKESGIKNRDAEISAFLADLLITGINVATTGVLFTKADIVPTKTAKALMETP